MQLWMKQQLRILLKIFYCLRKKINRIEKYVKDNNVPKVSISQELAENENMFTRNGESYLLKDQHLNEVYEIIVSFDDINTLAKTLKNIHLYQKI